jgi:hypothetical protein
MKKYGFDISENLYQELLDWARLRNSLSHCPPKRHSYITLNEEDIEEYIQLLKNVLEQWQKQKDMV